MREDAKNELWMPMRIGNIQGWFSDMRIERSSVPEWLHFWELADEDSNGDPCWYKRNEKCVHLERHRVRMTMAQ